MTLQDIDLDTETVSRDRLDIGAKTRSNLFAWNGQFSPQLVHVLLETYACTGDAVLDPFMGSGTVLVEAGRCGLTASGADINPAAFLMAQTYRLINSPRQDRRALLERIGDRIRRTFGPNDLFRHAGAMSAVGDPKTEIVGLWHSETSPHGRQLIEALIIMSDFYKETFSEKSLLVSWNRLAATVEQLPHSEGMISPYLADTRALPLEAASVDLIITSPPYINVFNYHQQYRASAEALGWDLLHVARSEIGSNRKHRGNRFLTVIQYCLDIAETLAELRRVCRPGARIIMVVGRESTVRRTRVLNGDIVSRLGVRCAGLTAEKRQERSFTNRFGETIYEDILHFRVGSPITAGEASPLSVAEEALRSAYAEASEEAKPDIKDALVRGGQVSPSPLFCMSPRKVSVPS